MNTGTTTGIHLKTQNKIVMQKSIQTKNLKPITTMIREKKVIDRNNYSIEEAEKFLLQYTNACSNLKKLEAELELRMNALRAEYEDEILEQVDKKSFAFEKLEIFATNNQEYFEARKSIEFTFGTLGFRMGTPKLKTLKGFTWSRVLEKVKKHVPDFVRVKEELNKEELISYRNDKTITALYKTIGVEVVQEETFFVQPKTELLS
jgi:phage host-nuclease inhibitor protein Gam